ncbi:tyrosine-protein kinase transmembrane receptor Ror-like [Daphnia carinata]|uniref:tyrosine-protein kinase transmembrane receptor Ror-like n=1 Tax=Daphnia carinata TaxID=120202 RepID=UPI00257C5E38|nr:tyrosine-protein kinase transmembrane receptor Ror-like [Daphnia carinata]
MAPQQADATGAKERTGAKDCDSARCGIDAGCRKGPDGYFICICTHDLSLQRPDGSCPRFVVTGQHHPTPNRKTLISIQRKSAAINQTGHYTQQPLIDRHPNLIPTIPGSLPAMDSELETSVSASTTAMTWLVPALGIAMVLTIVAWLRRRMRHKKKSRRPSSSTAIAETRDAHYPPSMGKPAQLVTVAEMPVCLTKNVLHQERFTNNPEYDWNADRGSTGSGADTSHLLESAANDQFKSFVIIRPEWIELKQEIGEGCFGKVFRGSLRRPNGQPHQGPNDEAVAVKVLKAAAGPTGQEDLLQEAEIMISFSHPNILSLKGIVINEPNIGPWLVFEYMALGDLAQLLRSANGNLFAKTKTAYSLNQDDLHSIAGQIADGMAYLSSQHFVHRDLACRNCLVGERPQGGGLAVKISDFGMSRDVYTCDYYKIGGSRMLPVRWMPPEAILYGKFTIESDVWSFGVVLWEMFALGVQPYYGHSNEQVVKLILQGILLTPPNLAPPLICQLLNGCWKTQPADRLTFAEIHSKLKRRARSNETWTPSAVTYVHLRHDDDIDQPDPNVEYLQTLPDLPVHHYTNT